MASRRIKSLAAVSTLVVGVGAYYIYSVFAVQGQGTLAQAPLNVSVQTPPAFIMALDDSGSMTQETLSELTQGSFHFRNFSDGNGYWGFFNRGTDRPQQTGTAFGKLFPSTGRGSGDLSIPPVDTYAFSRSPVYNSGYFDPTVVYKPWQKADGSPYDARTYSRTAAPADARPAGSPGLVTHTFDLTQSIRGTNTGAAPTNVAWRFPVVDGMVLPAGTVFWLPAGGGCLSLRILPGVITDDWNTLAADHTITGAGGCRIGIEYFPATFYLATPTVPGTYGYTATPVAITDPVGGHAGTLYKYEIKPGNFSPGPYYDDAIQNFTHYFSFYRNRMSSVIAASTISLVDVFNMRVGWFPINSHDQTVVMRDMGLVTEKQLLFNGLYRLDASGNTPNRSAVRNLGEQFKRTDAGAPVQLSCQKNAGMLFTDGFTNQDGSGFDANPTGYGNVDATMGPPFADTASNTMADIAASYYLTSLVAPDALEQNAVKVPEGCNVVPPALPPPNLDCQRNLHMNFYAVTLGLIGNVYRGGYALDPADPGYIDPYVTPPTWNHGVGQLNNQSVDEIWHATYNTRGKMINTSSPAAITQAMQSILESVLAGTQPSGTIGLTGARIGAGSLSVVPFYETRTEGTDWYSRLTAESVSSNPLTGEVTTAFEWEAAAEIPGWAAREVWFGDGPTARRFDAINITLDELCDNPAPGMSRCTPATITALGADNAMAVRYLLGDISLEERNGGLLRDRSNRLGDIVNSTPTVSAPTDDYGYRTLPLPYGTSYATYLTTGKAGRRPMVYAGANDGMLHAFDGGTDSAGGREQFAYIPSAVLGHMGNLLQPYRPALGPDQIFKHRYYVDGPVVVSDAYYGGAWETVLVGTTGAGGRGVFALNVSSPGSFAASDRLWEINDQHADSNVRDGIGHVLGKPVVVPVKTGPGPSNINWKAIFGNGYNSIDQRAVLFIVDIASGDVTTVEAEETTPPAGPNGLGNIVVVDRWGGTDLDLRIRDGFADTVYAGDQNGAVWKFDLRTASPPDLDRPVFIATDDLGNRQPIIGGMTAATGPAGGVMVYFGTGSFSFESDPIDTSVQTIYAFNDLSSGTTRSRSNLFEQSIVTLGAGSRTTTSGSIPVGLYGWYLDLPDGERFVGNPRVESGLVFFPTFDPNATITCTADGTNWLYGLNALNGSAGLSNVRVGSPTGGSPGTGTGAIALNTGGTAPVRDVAVLTSPRIPPLGPGATPAQLAAALAAGCSMVIQVAGAPPLYLPRPCGRQSWRQIQ